MLIEALFFTVFVSLINAVRISDVENRYLRKECSAAPPLPYKGVMRSFGGRRVLVNEFPFLVSIFYTDGKIRSMCSGVLISSRHILTAAHCVVNYDSELYADVCEREQEFTMYDGIMNPDGFTLYLGSRCSVPAMCNSPKKAAKIYVHDNWGKCDSSNDIAIIELAQDFNPKEAYPICMPRKNTKLAQLLKAAGIGTDPTADKNAPDKLQVIDVNVDHAIRTPGTILAWSRTASLCQGDSGGPLFQPNTRTTYMVMGIASTATRCDMFFINKSANFVDVRYHLGWICAKTGVCP